MKLGRRLGRIARFAGAYAQHVSNGKPKASQEQIDERLGVCQACPHLKGTHCGLCGCACGSNKKFLNKLAWADQACPDGRWGAVAPTESAETEK